MESIQQQALSQKRKCRVLSFQCDPDFRRAIDMELAARQVTLRDAATAALAAYLNIELPSIEPSTRSAA